MGVVSLSCLDVLPAHPKAAAGGLPSTENHSPSSQHISGGDSAVTGGGAMCKGSVVTGRYKRGRQEARASNVTYTCTHTRAHTHTHTHTHHHSHLTAVIHHTSITHPDCWLSVLVVQQSLPDSALTILADTCSGITNSFLIQRSCLPLCAYV